jgi:membrane protease YdiL (CAAX protease family)
MKSRSLILTFFVSMSIVTLVALVNCPNSTSSLNAEGARGAYFTQVEYPTIAYEGKDSFWNFAIYNKNCTINGEDDASFFFKFYLDGNLWWNEYNSTDYKTWQCSTGNLVTRLYQISTWDAMKPVNHELKIELYWYDGNVSRLQDVVSLPASVAVRVEFGNLMISSYIAVYLVAIFLIGFYVLIEGPIKISFTPPQNNTVASYQQSTRTMVRPSLKGCKQLFLFFYLFVFASWQMVNALFYAFPFLEQLRPFVYLMVQTAYIVLLVLLMRKSSSNFGGYGYLWPEEPRKYIAISLLLAVLYSFVTIIIPGVFAGYDVFPSVSFTEFFLVILLALVASFASETIFRGYIQSRLTKLGGFPSALLTTSIMFALYELTLLPFNLFHFFYEILVFLAVGIFLGILFYRTKTLLCPIIFYFTISIFKSLVTVRAITSEYAELFFNFVALLLSLLLLSTLAVKEESRSRTSSYSFS